MSRLTVRTSTPTAKRATPLDQSRRQHFRKASKQTITQKLQSEGEPEGSLVGSETCGALILLCRSAPLAEQADFSWGGSKQSLISGSARMLQLGVRMWK